MTEQNNPSAVENQPNPQAQPSAVQPRILGAFHNLGIWLQGNWGVALTMILIVFAALWIGWTMYKNPLILSDLKDQAYARGVITFLITIVTMVMAFLLVIQSFTIQGEDAEKRFSRAREVFTVLMGVLGTIVGFYFGSVERPLVSLDIAEIRVTDKQLLTHISGGTKPYRYSITSSDRDFKTIKNRTSEDGWIVETLEQPLKAGTTILLDVTDSKDQKASKEFKPETHSSKLTPAKSNPKPATMSTFGRAPSSKLFLFVFI
jgi:hypothetical protein